MLEIAEEIGARVEHHQVVLAVEGLLVGVQAAIQFIKFAVLAECPGIDFGGHGVAFTAQLLTVAFGVGQHNLPLAVGVGANFFRFLFALGAQLFGHALALGVHPVVHPFADGRVQVNPLQAHIDDFNAEAGGIRVHGLPHHVHNFPAVPGDHLLHRAPAEFLAQAVVDALGQPRPRVGFAPL